MRKTKHGKITENPRLLKMWAFDLNPENPETISTGASKDDYYWYCEKCGKPFPCKPTNIKTGLCPSCAYKEGAKKRVEKQRAQKSMVTDIPKLRDIWSEQNVEDPSTVSIGISVKRYLWKCPECNDVFPRSPYAMLHGSGLCKNCAHRNATEKHKKQLLTKGRSCADNPEMLKHWDYERNDKKPEEVSEHSSTSYRYFICDDCGESYPCKPTNQTTSLYLCKDCKSKVRAKTQRKSIATYSETVSDYPNMMAIWDWSNTEAPYDLSARSGIIVKWKCDCGNTWPAKPCDRIKMLPQCMPCSMRKHNNRRKERAIEQSGTWGENNPELAKEWHPTLNGNLTPYDLTPGCSENYWWLCAYGHSYQTSPKERSERHAGCPICNFHRQTSFAEQAIGFYLEKVTEIKTQVHAIINSKLDIFLPDKKIVIEYDGSYWHNRPTSKVRDANKDLYCAENGLRIIRIKEGAENLNEQEIIIFNNKENDFQWLLNTLCTECDLPYVVVDIRKDTPAILERMILMPIETSLEKKAPHCIPYWDQKENGKITPAVIGYTSSHIMNWCCPECKQRWKEKVSNVTHRVYPCKRCGKNKIGASISKSKKEQFAKKKKI